MISLKAGFQEANVHTSRYVLNKMTQTLLQDAVTNAGNMQPASWLLRRWSGRLAEGCIRLDRKSDTTEYCILPAEKQPHVATQGSSLQSEFIVVQQ